MYLITEVADLPDNILTSVCASVTTAEVKMIRLIAWYFIVHFKFGNAVRKKSVDYNSALKLAEVLQGNFSILQHRLNISEYSVCQKVCFTGIK